MARWTLVVNGHVVAELNDATCTIYPLAETQRDRDYYHKSVRQRWDAIVDTMLAGQRETAGGKVIPA